MSHSAPREIHVADGAAMRRLGAEMARVWSAGDIVLLEGELGAGKTTLVRGVLEGLGWTASVRSPTFALVQVFPTDPPVLHADLYRVERAAGLGIEEACEGRLCLIEWADRLAGLVDEASCWRVAIVFAEDGRRVSICPPSGDRS